MADKPIPPEPADADEVVATVDREGPDDSFVLADLTRDEAWLSMKATEAPLLDAWR